MKHKLQTLYDHCTEISFLATLNVWYDILFPEFFTLLVEKGIDRVLIDDCFEYANDLRGDGLDDSMMLWLNSGQYANIARY